MSVELLNTCDCCRDGGTWEDLLRDFERILPPPHERIAQPRAFLWRFEPDRGKTAPSNERTATNAAKHARRNGLADEVREGRRTSWILLGAVVSGAEH
jgi:hypothetical protein